MTHAVFIALAGSFVALFFLDRSMYEYVLGEDRLVENATAVALFIAGGVFVAVAGRRRRAGMSWSMPAGLAVLLVIGAFEEISWGQRIFGVQSPELFQRYSDQREINLHGVLQRLLAIRTKDVAAVAVIVYAVVMPWLLRTNRVQLGAAAPHLIFPPRSLAVPFIIGAAFMIDVPTGREEEIGEFLLSLCLSFFAAHELRTL
jgi:hypothetical protein